MAIVLAFCACTTDHAVANPPAPADHNNPMTAQEWNKDVVGWNLGNQFECSAPGQDGSRWP